MEQLLPEGLQAQLAAITLAAAGSANAYLTQHSAFRREHRAAYEQALERWRASQYAEWAIVFDFADQAGYRLTKKQRELRKRVFAATTDSK